GLFEAIGARLASDRLPPRALLVALLALVAVVSAVLNLDTSVVFLTPVLVHAARRRGLDERPFLYGAVFMSNSASLLLPGSNLTNLLVVGREGVTGVQLGTRMLPAWLAACAIPIVGVALAVPPARRAGGRRGGARGGGGAGAPGLGLGLREPALPVLAVGVAATALARLRPRLDLRAPALLFVLALALGTLGRACAGPRELLDAGGPWRAALAS